MEEARKQAYRVILSAGLLHLKWDLANWYHGLDLLSPFRAIAQSRRAKRAARRSRALYNLAIYASDNFARFSEALFWADIASFRQAYPDDWCDCRALFDRCLRGEPFAIIAPNGIDGFAELPPEADRGGM